VNRFAGIGSHFLAWLPDNKGIVYVSKGKINVVALDTKEVVELIDTNNTGTKPQVSPDGRFIAYSAIRNRHRSLYVFDRIRRVEIPVFYGFLNCDVEAW